MKMEMNPVSLSRIGVKRCSAEAGMKAAVFLCTALFAVAPRVFAGEAAWSKPSMVVELTPTGQQRYEFRLNLSENPAGCKNPNTFYQDYDSVGSERMYNLLLQALSDDKKVRVHVTGRCELNGYAEISAVSMIR